MPDWFAVTGAITNVATAIDMGYRYRPTEIVYGKDAGDILKQVDEILKHSKDVLENHKGLLEDELYEDLCDKHRIYHWQMTDENQGHRATRDEIIRSSRILSELYASEDSRQTRAETLLATVEQYQTDVLSASQTAHQIRKGKPIALFPDVKNKRVEMISNPTRSFTSWFSIFNGASRDGSQTGT